MVEAILFWAWLASTVFGFALGSYGVLRESFADLSALRSHGEGRYGEGPYGGRPSVPQDRLVRIGVALRLLPGDRALTVTDRSRNAAAAIAGVLLIGLSIVLDLMMKAVSP